MLVVGLGAFGLLIGSFLNVVIARVPAGRSIVTPGSACGSCGASIRARDNIPLLSWLQLRGRCRDCQAPISARYPLVEVAGAAAFVLVAVRFGPDLADASALPEVIAASIVLLAYLYLAAISLALAVIDLDTRRLPNAIVLPAYPVGIVLLGAASAVSGDYAALVPALIGAVGLGGLYLVLALIGGMGMGDVKLAGVLGLFLGWLGWDVLAVGAFAAFLAGGVYGLVLLLARRATRKTAIPFGPWMLAGAWFGITAGAPLAAQYLSLFGITG